MDTNNGHIEFESKTVFEDCGNTGIALGKREIADEFDSLDFE